MSLLNSLGLTVAYDPGFRQILLDSIVLVIISLKNIGPGFQGFSNRENLLISGANLAIDWIKISVVSGIRTRDQWIDKQLGYHLDYHNLANLFE